MQGSLVCAFDRFDTEVALVPRREPRVDLVLGLSLKEVTLQRVAIDIVNVEALVQTAGHFLTAATLASFVWHGNVLIVSCYDRI